MADKSKTAKQQQGWTSARRLIVAVVAVLAGCSLMTPAVPVLAAVWSVAAAVLYLWPDPAGGAYQPLTESYRRALSMRAARKYLWHGLTRGPWRIGAEGDNDGNYGNYEEPHPEQQVKRFSLPKRKPKQEQGEAPEPKKTRPLVALNAVAAALAATCAVGAEQLASLSVSSVPLPSSEEIAARVHPSVAGILGWAVSGRDWWLQAVAAPMGWAAVKSATAWHRMHRAYRMKAAPEDLAFEAPPVCSPTAFVSNPHVDSNAPRTRSHTSPMRRWSTAVACVAATAGVTAFAFVSLGPRWAASVALTVFPALALIGGWHAVRPWVSEQRAPWDAWQKEIADWESHWGTVLGANKAKPVLASIQYFPGPGENGNPVTPMYKMLVFAMPVGTDFAAVKGLADRLKPAVHCDLMHISPGQATGMREPTWSYVAIKHELDAYDQWVNERLGVWKDWSFQNAIEIDKQTAYHDPAIDSRTRGFLLERQLGRAMIDLKIGILLAMKAPTVRSVGADKPAYLKFVISLHGATTYESLKKNLHNLAEKLQAKWLRFEFMAAENAVVGHLCAIHPEGVRFSRHMDRPVRREIIALDWQWWMSAANLYGSDKVTTPQLISAATINESSDDPESVIHKLRFLLPPGLTAAHIEAKTEQLSTASHFPFVTVEQESVPQEITLLAGYKDPLDEQYTFNDYLDMTVLEQPMISGPDTGSPRTGWCVGIGSDGTPMVMEWEHEEPHMLVAGASGAGKSMIINSMMTQLLVNNDPDDVEIWLFEPKNELHRYAHKAHVRVFLDSHVAEGTLYEVAGAMFAALEHEMNRRYALMHQHPDQPQKIAEAREIGKRDPNYEHLKFRYIFCVVEECASLFEKPGSSDDNAAYKWMDSKAKELARKSRACGIHLIFATQDPKRDSIPSLIKRQCRRVGLRTTDRMGSQIVIDTGGLEKIQKPGRGLMTGPRGYTGYKAFFLSLEDLTGHMDNVGDSGHWPKLPPGIEPASEHDISLTPAVE